MFLDRVRALADAFARLDGEQLTLIVPLVERRVLVEALITLQPNELRRVHRGERLGNLGLADPRLALQQQRALQELHEPERGGEVAVGHVSDFSEPIGDMFARQIHERGLSTSPFLRRCCKALRTSSNLPPAAPTCCETRFILRSALNPGILFSLLGRESTPCIHPSRPEERSSG